MASIQALKRNTELIKSLIGVWHIGRLAQEVGVPGPAVLNFSMINAGGLALDRTLGVCIFHLKIEFLFVVVAASIAVRVVDIDLLFEFEWVITFPIVTVLLRQCQMV